MIRNIKIVLLFFLILLYNLTEGQEVFSTQYYALGPLSGHSGIDIFQKDSSGYWVLSNTYNVDTSSFIFTKISTDRSIDYSKYFFDTLYAANRIQGKKLKYYDQNNLILFNQSTDIGLFSRYISSGMISLDDSGNVLWSATYLDTSFTYDINITSIEPLYDGGFLGTGFINENLNVVLTDSTAACIFRADSLGNILWQQKVGVHRSKFVDVKLTSDSCIMVIGKIDSLIPSNQFYSQYIFYSKLNLNGQVMWSKWFGPFDMNVIYEVVESENAYYLFGRTRVLDSTPGTNGFMIKIDSLGNILIAKEYGLLGSDDEFSTGTVIDTNIFCVISDWKLLVLNSSGDISQYVAINTFPGFYIPSLNQTVNGNLFGLDSRSQSGGFRIFKLDHQFNSCYSMPFTNYQTNNINLIVDTLFLDLHHFNFISKQNKIFSVVDTVFQKLDYCSFTIGMNEEELISKILIFPNPCTDKIEIKYEFPVDLIELFDSKGIKVFSKKYNGMVLSHEIIMTTNLESGMYILKCISFNSIIYRKILKL